MAGEGAVASLHDQMAVSPEDWLKNAEIRRNEQLRRIKAWEDLPIYSIFRKNQVIYARMLAVMEADLRVIDNGIALVKARKAV